MPKSPRTSPCTRDEARARQRTAQAYLEVAGFVLKERGRDEYLNVAAGLGRLLSLKDAAHYDVHVIGPRRAADAQRWAAILVERSTEEVER